MVALIIAFLTNWSNPNLCSSTVFGYPGDGYGGRTPTVLTGKPVTDADVGIAHRTWRMGTKVKIRNIRNGKVAYGVVLDRGPYGMKDDKGWFNSAREKERAKALIAKVGKRKAYLSCADLTPSMAKLIGAKGRTVIEIRRERKYRKKR